MVQLASRKSLEEMVIPLTPVTPRDSVCLCLGCWEVRECLLEKRDHRGLIAVLALAYVSVHGFRVLVIAATDGPATARYCAGPRSFYSK